MTTFSLLRFLFVSGSLLASCGALIGACGGNVIESSSGGGGGTTMDCTSLPPLPEPDGVTCPAGYWYYTDQTCNTEDPDGPTQCAEVGDHKCHKLCDSDADCVGEPCRPHCVEVELYNSIDACFAVGFSICDADEYFYCY